MRKIFNIQSILKLTAAIFLFSGAAIFAQTDEKTEANLARQYQKLALSGKPVYISTDLAFEQVIFFFSDALEQIEKEKLAKNLETGLTDALDKTAAALKSEKDGVTREILTNNYAYLLTALRLLLPESDANLKAANARAAEFLISPDLRNIKNELDLIFAAKELNKSPLLGYTEDYTQYTPRGRYTKSEDQTRYFRTAVWLGRMGFYTEPNAGSGIDEKAADLLTARGATLLKTIGAVNAFTDYDKTLTALVGASDDLTISESTALIEKALNKKITDAGYQEIITAAPKIRAVIKTEARKPRILSTVAVEGTPNPTAIRLIGQRFTPDSYVFQNLTFSMVQEYTGSSDKEPFTLSVTADGRKVRGVPRIFDVLDALGIDSANTEITLGGDDLYQNYQTSRERIKKEMPALLAVNNYPNLYLAAIKAQNETDSKTSDNSAKRRRLNAAAGAYTLMRHELAAYAKQSYTNIGRGLNQTETVKRRAAPPTFVENAPNVFLNLKSAVELISAMPENKILTERGRKLAAALQMLSNSGGDNQLSKDKSDMLWKTIDEWAVSDRKSACITDVHTDLNSKQILQIGLGQPHVIELNINNQKLQSVIFTTFEFRQPLEKRLTDQEWQKIIFDSNDPVKYRKLSILNDTNKNL